MWSTSATNANTSNDFQENMHDSSSFPFESRYLQIFGFNIHYVEEGKGRPILFVHGNPTWSYIWRNIIPILARCGRCIAFDLLGLGKSDKPPIDYSFQQCYGFVSEFINRMGLKDPILVLHDWGGAFGFWYAIHNPDKIKGIAVMEPVLLTSSWDDYEGERRRLFESFRDPRVNYGIIQVANIFVESMPTRVWNKERMTEAVMNKYREPFPTPASRKALRRFPEMLPIGKNSETIQIFRQIEAALLNINVPILLLTVKPGALMNDRKTTFLKDRIRDLTIEELGPGLHYVQEDYPEEIAHAIARWMDDKKI